MQRHRARVNHRKHLTPFRVRGGHNRPGAADKAHDVVLREWASAEYSAKVTLPGTTAGPVAFSADSRTFAAAANEPDEIRLFETASGHERGRIRGFRGSVRALAFGSDGRWLASGMSDSSVLIWDLTAVRKE